MLLKRRQTKSLSEITKQLTDLSAKKAVRCLFHFIIRHSSFRSPFIVHCTRVQPLPLPFRAAFPAFRAAGYALRWPPLAAEDDRGWAMAFIVACDNQLMVFDSPTVRRKLLFIVELSC